MKKAILFFVSILSISLFTPAAMAMDAAPAVSAEAAILIDGNSGQVLFEKNPDQQMLIASTTKILTALVTLEHANPDDIMVVPVEATLVEGSSMYLKAGEEYTVRDVLYGLLLVSGNDAALALAMHVAGTQEDFVALMNEKATELGMEHSSFANPHGLDAETHYSTARDMARLMQAAMQNETFREISGTKSYNIGDLTHVNHNKLLWRYEGTTGGKTGYTMAAGRTLVSSAERDGTTLIAVTLRDPDDWSDHAALYDWGFSNFVYESLLPVGEYTRIPVISGEGDSVGVAPNGDLKALIQQGIEPEIRLELPRFVFAGVRAGAYAGELYAYHNGIKIGQIDLCYTESVSVKDGEKLTMVERLKRSVSRDNTSPALSYYLLGPLVRYYA